MKKCLVRQQDESDCGSACLLSIIKYYDGYVPFEQVKIDTMTNINGTNFYYLKTAAEKYGFQVLGKKEKLENIKVPAICQIEDNGFNHFVVIYKIDKEITIMDPAKGLIKVNKKDFEEVFTEKVLELYPRGNIIKYKKENHFLKIIKNIYLNNIKSILKTLLLVIILILLSLITSFNLLLIQNNKYIIFVFIIIISKVIINYFRNINVTLLNNKINYSLLKTYTNKIINLPLKYLQLKKPGDFINRINDLHTIKDFFTKTLIEIIINIIFFISTLIILFVLNTNLTVILFILSIIYITVVSLMNKKLYKQITTLIDAENIFTDRVVEYLNKITTIKTLKSSYFINNLDSDIKKSLNLKLDFDYKLSKIDLVKNSFEELMLILILLLHFNITKNITSAIIFISIYGYFLESIKFASDIMPSLLYLKEIYYRISSVYDLDLKKKTKKIGKDIEIKNLSFSYNKLDNVLDNLNLNINEGEKVLLEGANGSGKSTLLNIISGLYDYDHGNVKVPSKVSYIDQKSELFRGSIIDNIILDKRFDKEKFKRLEKILYLKEIIKNKSLGYNTNLESISNLSGGERQKIIMARTLYQDFNLLIMDESLSLISKDIRSKILKNINKYYRDKTIIYVSHYDDNFSFNKKINLTAREEKYVNR